MSRWLGRTFSVNTLVILLYTGAVSFGFNFLKQVSRKFELGNLRRLLLGKYSYSSSSTTTDLAGRVAAKPLSVALHASNATVFTF